MALRTPPPLACGILALLAHAACGDGPSMTVSLDREQLMDPEECRSCHPTAYQEWSGSMHAYAAEIPSSAR